MKIMNIFTAQRNNKKDGAKGFTLIEMMVAVGLFAIVMLIATAVIFSIINGNRKSQTINTVVNNLNFSLESMIRDIKTGYWYSCADYRQGSWPTVDQFKSNYQNQGQVAATGCTAVSDHISFVSTLSGVPRVVEYYYVPSNVNGPGAIWKTYYDETLPGGAQVDAPLTTPDMEVQQFDLYINNPPPATSLTKSSAVQPNIFLIVRGNVQVGNKDSDVSSFGVQTFISQRLLNI